MDPLPFSQPSEITSDFRNRIVSGTGHRPQKLGGYSDNARADLVRLATDWLSALEPRGVISGLALGWDSALVEACWTLALPYIACAPFSTQASKWPLDAQRRYEGYVARAARFEVCSTGGYSPAKMQIRNERMVDLALKDGPENGLMLALWDGSTGGTRNCLSYAFQRRLPIINAWAEFIRRAEISNDGP